ncbi:MAG: phage tail protein [Halobacteriovoraceae bacterium]|nr:phage tail protein [Halobacteriovoraceae bacterium]
MSDLLQTGNFEVTIDGMPAFRAISVDGIGIDITPNFQTPDEKTKEKVSKRGNVDYPGVTISREFTGNKDFFNWIKDCTTKNTEDLKKNISIVVKNESNEEVIRYNLQATWPTNYIAPKFAKRQSNATEGSIEASERIVLDVQSVELA